MIPRLTGSFASLVLLLAAFPASLVTSFDDRLAWSVAEEISSTFAVSVSTLRTLEGTFLAASDVLFSERALIKTLYSQSHGMAATYVSWKDYSIALPWFWLNLFGDGDDGDDGDGSESRNYFMYTQNSSWQSRSSPVVWNHTKSGGFSLDMGNDALMSSFWLSETGDRINPPFQQAPYPVSKRPMYLYAVANGSGFVPQLGGYWLPRLQTIMPTLVASVTLGSGAEKATGIAASGFAISFIEQVIAGSMEIGDLRDPSTVTTLYVLTESGRIMLTNQPGLAYECGWETFHGAHQPMCTSKPWDQVDNALMRVR